MSWHTGAADIDAALTAGELQKVSGAQAAGQAWITDAQTKLATARTIATSDPATAYVTAAGPSLHSNPAGFTAGALVSQLVLLLGSPGPRHIRCLVQ